MSDDTACTIAFLAEAYDWAARAYEALVGLHVNVHPVEGSPFTGKIEEVWFDAVDGQLKLTIARVEDGAVVEDEVPATFEAYGQLDRIEVI